MGPAKKSDDRSYTYADYCTWPDDERWELVDGVAYAMGPAPVRRHQPLVGELLRQIANALKDGPCRPYVAPFDVRLPRKGEKRDGARTVLQPDISVICDRAKLDEKGCVGAPDWVVEVLSPATASRDQIENTAPTKGPGCANTGWCTPWMRLSGRIGWAPTAGVAGQRRASLRRTAAPARRLGSARA